MGLGKMSEKSSNLERSKRLIVIRLRGRVSIKWNKEDTLKMLNLHRVHHACIIDDRKSYNGMLQKVKDYATWGVLDEKTCLHVLQKRARLEGNEPLTDDYIQKFTKFKTIEEFSKAFMSFKAELKDLPHLKPVFRLHPPRKGFKYTKKRPFGDYGELGFRNEQVQELVERML